MALHKARFASKSRRRLARRSKLALGRRPRPQAASASVPRRGATGRGKRIRSARSKRPRRVLRSKSRCGENSRRWLRQRDRTGCGMRRQRQTRRPTTQRGSPTDARPVAERSIGRSRDQRRSRASPAPLRDAHCWLDELLNDPTQTIESLAVREGKPKLQKRALDPNDAVPCVHVPRSGGSRDEGSASALKRPQRAADQLGSRLMRAKAAGAGRLLSRPDELSGCACHRWANAKRS